MRIDSELLPVQVWEQLDPRAGQLSPAARRRGRRVAIVAVVAIIGLLVVWQSGAVLPRVTTGMNGNGMMADPAHHRFEQTVEVRNSGWTSMTVDGIGRNGSGLRLTSVDATFPVELPPSTGRVFSLSYDVTNCAAIQQGEWAIPVRVQRAWGVWSAWVRPQPFVPMGVDITGMRRFSGSDPYAKEWQAALAFTACAPGAVGPTPIGAEG